MWRSGALSTVSHVDASGSIHFAAVLDDREDALTDPMHPQAWREWLRLSNLLGFRIHPTSISAVTLASSALAPTVGTPSSTVEGVLTEAWQEAVSLASSEVERALLVGLASAGIPVPEQGFELPDGQPIDVCWPAAHIVVDLGLSPEVARRVAESGWSVVPATVEAITAAFAE